MSQAANQGIQLSHSPSNVFDRNENDTLGILLDLDCAHSSNLLKTVRFDLISPKYLANFFYI